MKIFASFPRGVRTFKADLTERWLEVGRASSVPVAFTEPNEFETHGNFLTRLWQEVWLDLLAFDNEPVLVSELDFAPTPYLLPYLQSLRDTFVFARYQTRNYQPDADVSREPGKIVTPTQGSVPLVGPWVMFLPPGSWARDVPVDWLDAAGPFNDAANFAAVNLLTAGIIRPGDPLRVQFLKPKDLFPLAHGSEYFKPGDRTTPLGAHLFFARSYDAPNDAAVCWPECRVPYTGRRLRMEVGNYLYATAIFPEVAEAATRE